MNIKANLMLLSMSAKFKVTSSSESTYQVTFKEDWDDYPLQATYEDGTWNYYMGGIYNSGLNWAEIDIDKLNELISFTKSLEGGDSK